MSITTKHNDVVPFHHLYPDMTSCCLLSILCSNLPLHYWQFICDPQDLKQVGDALTARFPDHLQGMELEYIPHTLVSVTEPQMQKAEKLIDHISNYPDVVRVFDNIKDFPSSTCKLFADS